MKRYRYFFFFFLMKYIGDRELDVPCVSSRFFSICAMIYSDFEMVITFRIKRM